MHRREQRVDDDQGEGGADAQVGQLAGDAPDRHHREGQRRALQEQRGRPGSARRCPPAQRVDRRTPACWRQQVGAGGDGEDRLLAVVDQPDALGVAGQVDGALERPDPGGREELEDQEEADGEGPRQDAVGPLRYRGGPASAAPRRRRGDGTCAAVDFAAATGLATGTRFVDEPPVGSSPVKAAIPGPGISRAASSDATSASSISSIRCGPVVLHVADVGG